MRLLIRYFRPQIYGDFTTLKFENVDPSSTHVLQLKHKVFIKARVQPRSQRLLVRNKSGAIIEMANESLLSAYSLSEEAIVILENNQAERQNNELVELMLSRSPSYESDNSQLSDQSESSSSSLGGNRDQDP